MLAELLHYTIERNVETVCFCRRSIHGFKGQCVLLGVTGGIAAYKMANVASALRKLGADVEVIMTKKRHPIHHSYHL